MSEEDTAEAPEQYARFLPTVIMQVTFTMRERSQLSTDSGNDVTAAITAIRPDAEVRHDVKCVTAKVRLAPTELGSAKELYDRLYSAMFMRVNYGKDAAIIEAMLQAHPELTALPDLNRLLLDLNALLQTIRNVTDGIKAERETLTAEQLNTLTVDRYGRPEDNAEAHADGSLRDFDPLSAESRLQAGARGAK